MYKYNGKVIRPNRAWSADDGLQHPANWMKMSDSRKTEIGLVYEADPVVANFDNRFYWSAGVERALDDVNAENEDGTPMLDISGSQVVIKGLKSNAIAQTKVTAAGLLAPTDWMVVRSAENGTDVPSATLAYRQNVRAASETIEAAISGASTHAAFMALYDAPVDADGVPTTDNAAINDWPEA
jgi:hypothetical protein